MKLGFRPWAAQYLLPFALAMAVAAGITACGGGGGDTVETPAPAAPSPATPAPAAAMSSGVITAFGSVFVNGRRFRTDKARVIDDDTETETGGVGGLEVGMVVDVRHRGDGDDAEADELHVHPLARGFVDAADDTEGTVTVMGQTVRLSSATLFSDRRACLAAATPCPVIVTADGLAATTVSGTITTPGSYVTVHGFLFDSATADIVATLVSVSDPPTGPSRANFKAEGVATVSASGVSINGLALDLSQARCRVGGRTVDCNGAFTSGAVVSAGATAAPALPATLLVADFARQSRKVPVETPGAAVELEGVVSAVTGSSTFVVRGMTVDISGLPASTQLPSVGDATNIRPGSITATFTVSVLGQTITVNRLTRLADRSRLGWHHGDPSINPLNITTFRAYLAASTSKDVLVIAEEDRLGRLVARSLVILPATDVSALAGTVDAMPAVVNSQTPNTPTVFFVHGIRVRADPRAVRAVGERNFNKPTTIVAGDRVVVFGTFVAGSIVVGPDPAWGNRVVDFGQPGDDDEDHDNGNHFGQDKDKKDKKEKKDKKDHWHHDRGLF